MKATMGQVVVVWLVALLLCTTTTASSSSMAIPSSSQAEANPSSCQYYVSAQRGQDSYGGSLAAPFRSLQHALQLIVNNGDLSEVAVCVEDGTYSISSANLTTQRFLYSPSFLFYHFFNFAHETFEEFLFFFEFDWTQQSNLLRRCQYLDKTNTLVVTFPFLTMMMVMMAI